MTKRPTNEGAEKLLGLYFPVLDNGFISLIDYMGTDQCIETSARVSYGGGTRKTSQTRGLLRYLRRHRHCYDAQTEVLTDRGFIKWPSVKKTDRLGIWDPELNSLLYEKPEYLTKNKYKGKMYKISHKKIDLLVTPDHNMYVNTKKWCPFKKAMIWAEEKRLIKACELGDKSTVRYFKQAPRRDMCCTAQNYNDPLFKIGKNIIANLKLIGFFIGDGFAGGTFANGISFHLKKRRKIEYLKKICNDGGFALKECKSNVFNVYGENFRDLFSVFYKNKKKVIPKCFLDLKQTESLALIDGLINSDGHVKRKTFCYASNSKNIIESLQIIGLHAGYAVNLNKPYNGLYKAMFMTNPDSVVNQGRRHTKFVKYNGYVYCAKTRTGILVVRRNGKIVLSGNSSPYEMVELKFHCSMPIFVARQLVRTRTANLNEISGRYSLLPMLFYTPTEEEFKKQSTTNNQGRSNEKFSAEKYKDVIDRWNSLRRQNQRLYEDLTDADVARELARIDLPLSTYTQWYWKIDLHNLFHFLTLRTDSHAQYETREYANVMAGMMKLAVPLSYEAWIDYGIGSKSFSRQEMEILQELVKIKTLDGKQYLQGENDIPISEIEKRTSTRESVEFFDKLTPKKIHDFNLDLSTAKSPEFFEKLMTEAAPKTYKSSGESR